MNQDGGGGGIYSYATVPTIMLGWWESPMGRHQFQQPFLPLAGMLVPTYRVRIRTS